MTALTVGVGLNTPAEFDSLPVGTVIGPENRGDERYQKNIDGWYLMGSNSGAIAGGSFSMNGYNKIITLPDGVNAPVYESLMQWQFRYRDNAYLSAASAGVSEATVAGAMTDLGLGNDYFPLGKGVIVGNGIDKNRLPHGTLIQMGQPDHLRSFGVFLKQHGGWTHLLGDARHHDGHRCVVLNGDPVDWAVTPGTEEEQAALANFKARAWRVGWKVKLNHRWCESYEQYMAQIGLTEAVLRDATYGGITVGEKVDIRSASHLPAGSVLRWTNRHDPDTWTWYIRDDNATNESRTRALFGHRTDGEALRNNSRSMEVVWIGDDGEMSLVVDNLLDIYPHMPVGTRFMTGASVLVKCHDQRLGHYPPSQSTPAEGAWDAPSFFPNLRVVGFPS